MFERILVPTDFSPSAERALAVARTQFPGAQLKLLHVVDGRALAVPDLTTGGVAPVLPPADIQREITLADEGRLERETEQGETHEMLRGDPVRGILQIAREWNADLIVMGTHGRHGLAHFFLGSLAEQIVRDAPVPVLTVRDPTPES